MRRILGCLIAVGLFVLLPGCASDQRSNLLTDTLNAYASAVRWGDYSNAEQFVDPDMRAAHPATAFQMAHYAQFKVSSYDDGQGAIPVSKDEVRQVVHIGLINVNTQSGRSIVDHQTWHYDETKKHWWLTSGLPNVDGS